MCDVKPANVGTSNWIRLKSTLFFDTEIVQMRAWDIVRNFIDEIILFSLSLIPLNERQRLLNKWRPFNIRLLVVNVTFISDIKLCKNMQIHKTFCSLEVIMSTSTLNPLVVNDFGNLLYLFQFVTLANCSK